MNKNVKTILFALLGIILLGIGILVTVFLYQQMSSRAAVEAAKTDAAEEAKVTVVVTTHDMFLGDLVGASDVTTISVPAEFVPRDSVASVDDAVNKFVKTDLVQGEMLLKHNLADPTNINHDIAYILNDNHVLFAFPAEDLMSVNSVIQRGDIVDILATISIEVGRLGPIEGEQTPVQAEGEEEAPEPRILTMDAYQAAEITALVADIIPVEGEEAPVGPPNRGQIKVKAYLLALPPQDALLLKHFIDTGAIFDMVLRAPTSRGKFELIPVTKEYIVELYGLGIVP